MKFKEMCEEEGHSCGIHDATWTSEAMSTPDHSPLHSLDRQVNHASSRTGVMMNLNQGNIDPNGLADYLVNMANQFSRRYAAQKLGQGDHLMVQIGRMNSFGEMRHAIGVSISRLPDGVSVAVGQANWLDPAMGGSLIGAIFWPPLLLFPLARGIRGYQMYQDIWDAVDMYCAQAGATVGQTTTSHAVYCQNCGAVNDEHAQACNVCGAPLPVSQPAYTAQSSSQNQGQPAQSYGSNEQVVCPNCGHTVPAANFCNNCAARLR